MGSSNAHCAAATYIAVAANRPNGKREFYYRCNGAHSPAVFSPKGKCCSKAIRGDELEQQVWIDVETFLRNPDPVLSELQSRLGSQAKGSDQVRVQLAALENVVPLRLDHGAPAAAQPDTARVQAGEVAQGTGVRRRLRRHRRRVPPGSRVFRVPTIPSDNAGMILIAISRSGRGSREVDFALFAGAERLLRAQRSR